MERNSNENSALAINGSGKLCIRRLAWSCVAFTTLHVPTGPWFRPWDSTAAPNSNLTLNKFLFVKYNAYLHTVQPNSR